MSEMVLSKIMRVLDEAKAYLEGERVGYRVTVPSRGSEKDCREAESDALLGACSDKDGA